MPGILWTVTQLMDGGGRNQIQVSLALKPLVFAEDSSQEMIY